MVWECRTGSGQGCRRGDCYLRGEYLQVLRRIQVDCRTEATETQSAGKQVVHRSTELSLDYFRVDRFEAGSFLNSLRRGNFPARYSAKSLAMSCFESPINGPQETIWSPWGSPAYKISRAPDWPATKRRTLGPLSFGRSSQPTWPMFSRVSPI